MQHTGWFRGERLGMPGSSPRKSSSNRLCVILTSNKAFKAWPSIFNNDSTVTSAVLDRVLHHCDTVLIEGNSFRMKDRIEPT